MDTLQELRIARDEFHNFERSVLSAELIRDEKCGYADLALRIENLQSRKKYRDLALKFLDASIKHHRPKTIPIERPHYPNQSITNTAIPITLIVAGIVLHLLGPATALVAAGLSYWLAAKMAGMVISTSLSKWRNHNSGVSRWKEQINVWEEERIRLFNVKNLSEL